MYCLAFLKRNNIENNRGTWAVSWNRPSRPKCSNRGVADTEAFSKKNVPNMWSLWLCPTTSKYGGTPSKIFQQVWNGWRRFVRQPLFKLCVVNEDAKVQRETDSPWRNISFRNHQGKMPQSDMDSMKTPPQIPSRNTVMWPAWTVNLPWWCVKLFLSVRWHLLETHVPWLELAHDAVVCDARRWWFCWGDHERPAIVQEFKFG